MACWQIGRIGYVVRKIASGGPPFYLIFPVVITATDSSSIYFANGQLGEYSIPYEDLGKPGHRIYSTEEEAIAVRDYLERFGTPP